MQIRDLDLSKSASFSVFFDQSADDRDGCFVVAIVNAELLYHFAWFWHTISESRNIGMCCCTRNCAMTVLISAISPIRVSVPICLVSQA